MNPNDNAQNGKAVLLERVVRAARRTQSQCSCCNGNGSYPPNLDEPTKLFKCPYCYELWEGLKALDATTTGGSNP